MAWELTGNPDATTTSFLGSTNAQPLIVRTGTAPSPTPPERLRITPDGKIGIGITTPQARLSVSGGGAVINGVAIGTDTAAVGYLNEHETVGAANPADTLRLQSPNGLAFHAGPPGATLADNERMTVTPGGNVGIGTTDPRHGRLTIEDDAAPLVLKATDLAPEAGGLWRVALDGGGLRFDANSAGGGDFSSFASPLTMTPGSEDIDSRVLIDGLVGIGLAPDPGYALRVGGAIDATDYHRDGKPLIAAGRTRPGLDWQQYGGNGVFIDVNTAEHRFSTTPVYVTALHGDGWHWATTGGSSVYHSTPTGFRVYVRWSDGRPLTVSEAQNGGWHIQWIGTETS